MKALIIICRILIGIVFIYSGFVKGVDPLGSTLKFIDYFVAFGVGFLEPIAFPLAILMCTAEFVIGICLLSGIRIKFATWAALLLMSFFTPLTLVAAIYNPVSDCGCFGDAIILTNWQTFWKNIIIIIPVIFIFLFRKKIKPIYNNFTEWSIAGIAFLFLVFVSIYSYRHLPLIDFRPYKVGANIPEQMKIPEDAESDIYETILYYEKNSVVKAFTLENYPWEDTTWTFVDQESKLIKEGYIPPIHDFNIITLDGIEITDKVLNDNNYSFLLVAYNLKKSNIKAIQKANDLAIYCSQNNHSFYALTSSATSEIEELKNTVEIYFDFYTTDETTLKTITRSNPGLLLIKEGIIIAKWHYNDFPTIKELGKNYLSSTLNNYRQKNEILISLSLFLFFILFISFYKIIINFFQNKEVKFFPRRNL